MKKFFVIGMLSMVSLTAMTSLASKASEVKCDHTSASCNYGTCSAYKQDGTKCRNCAQQYSSYCWSHKK